MEKMYTLPAHLRSCARWACCVSRFEETTDEAVFDREVDRARAYAENSDVACVEVEDLGWCKILRSRDEYGDWSAPYFLMTGWPTASQVRDFFTTHPSLVNNWRRDQVLARLDGKEVQ